MFIRATGDLSRLKLDPPRRPSFSFLRRLSPSFTTGHTDTSLYNYSLFAFTVGVIALAQQTLISQCHIFVPLSNALTSYFSNSIFVSSSLSFPFLIPHLSTFFFPSLSHTYCSSLFSPHISLTPHRQQCPSSSFQEAAIHPTLNTYHGIATSEPSTRISSLHSSLPIPSQASTIIFIFCQLGFTS